MLRLGEEFLVSSKEESKPYHLQHRIVGVYFSALWCPPCKKFTPLLVQAYQRMKEANYDIEIIFVSFDSSKYDFKKEYENMPWPAVPHSEETRLK